MQWLCVEYPIATELLRVARRSDASFRVVEAEADAILAQGLLDADAEVDTGWAIERPSFPSPIETDLETLLRDLTCTMKRMRENDEPMPTARELVAGCFRILIEK